MAAKSLSYKRQRPVVRREGPNRDYQPQARVNSRPVAGIGHYQRQHDWAYRRPPESFNKRAATGWMVQRKAAKKR